MVESDSTRAPTRADPDGPFELVVFDGPQLRRIPLAPKSSRDALIVGRGAGADVAVDAKSVSKRHARIDLGPPLTIEDVGSANGTFVNGERLADGRRASFGPSDILSLGDVMLVIRPVRAPAEVPPPSAPEGSMAAVWRLVDLAAPSDLSILVLGETGVGKEVVAQAIHERSSRSHGPLVRVNCAAIPETMIESELFGHERGAFTGATERKLGLLEAASGGTIVLDEVGELPLGVQAKLLRALDASEITRLGSVKPIKIDVRVIASTNRDLAAMVREGTFRSDLYYRLDGLTIHVPPLRQRPSEIPELAESFLRAAALKAGRTAPAIELATMRALVAHSWPGNVRELKKVVERAFVLAAGKPITAQHCALNAPPPSAAAAVPQVESASDLRGERERAEKRAVEAALAQTNGNQTRAAALLNISRRTLVERLDKYGFDRPRKK